MDSDAVLSSLPARPLALSEAEQLADEGGFVPLSMLSEHPEWLKGDSWELADFMESAGALVMTLLYSGEEYALAIGFSAPADGWVQIERWEHTQDVAPSEIETTVQKWGSETYPEWNHGTINPDEESL